MSQKKIEKYGLYQTFSSKIPDESLSEKEIGELLKKIEKISYEQKRAFFMLICEHARLNDDFQYNTNDVVLPYSIKQDGNDICIDFSKIPKELQWVLLRFSNVIDNPEKV